jgi:hypothetical protein
MWRRVQPGKICYVRATADSNPDRLELERDAPHRGDARELRTRLAELASSHPSAADYVSERPHRDSPSATSTLDNAWTDDDVRLTPERRAHILDGDETGGGHRHGTGEPGKTEFPAEWDDDRIVDAVLTVARTPDEAPERQDWNERWSVTGTRDGVELVAIVESDGRVWTAWPGEGSPGVIKNPLKDG